MVAGRPRRREPRPRLPDVARRRAHHRRVQLDEGLFARRGPARGQLAGARAQAFGSNSSYVLVERTAEGLVTIRNYRNRQVFHYPCEDLENASERGVMNSSGAVEVESGGIASREGKNLLFGAGGRITLGSPPWLQYVDGFMIGCRLRPAVDSTSSSLTLFSKGNRFRIWLQRNDEGGFDVRAAIGGQWELYSDYVHCTADGCDRQARAIAETARAQGLWGLGPR